MDELIKDAEGISYSDSDIKRYLDDDVRIIKYPELSKFNSVSEILGGASCACILYMTKENYGHWTALIKLPGFTGKGGSYEVFDPYGIFPDDELKFISEEFKEESNQDGMYLSNIIANDLKEGRIIDVVYNKYKLQKQMKDINTCGRWCAVRCAWKYIPIEAFASMFIDQKMTGDEYVTLMTLANR